MDTRETERILALRQLDALAVLDSKVADGLEHITHLAARHFKVPMAFISLIDGERQWIKRSVGMTMRETPRKESFCDYTIRTAEPMVIEDTHLDPRFRDFPLVTGPSAVRFYAGAPLLTADGHAIGSFCIADKVPRTMSEDDRAQLQRLASLVMSHLSLRRAVDRLDPISGMANSHQLADELDLLATMGVSEKRALVYLDMPDAAAAHDIASALGAAAYDELVRNTGRRLQTLMHEHATVFHIVGTRFALLSHAHDVENFHTVLGGMDDAFDAPLHIQNIPLNLALNAGMVSFNTDREGVLDAPRKALAAIKQAQSEQRRWSIYNEQEDDTHRRAFRLLNDIPQVLHADEFRLVFQPKLDLASNTCHSAEALLRWTHAELGAISPAEFIPLVEKTALVKPVTDWVLESAFRQMRAWAAIGKRPKIALNVSARNLEEPNICARLAELCNRYDISPSQIEIECTEGLWMNSEKVLQTLHDIRSLGMSIALDDFGTGYSNFSYLQYVPATTVKLDQSLIRNVHANQRDQRIVRSIIALAKDLDYRIVAEGVETEEIMGLVKEWGCDEVQGYFFARPVAAEEFLTYLN